MIPFLLATGERNCLDPITVSLPKPLLPVVNRPLIVYAVEFLASQGYRDIVVGLCEMADHIESTLGSGQRWNVQFQYLLQRHPSGIVDLLTRAASLLTETCLILPADLLVRFDIQAALDFHHAHGGPVTALLSPTASDHDRSPTLWLDQHHQIGGERSATARRGYDTGIYLIEPWLLKQLPQQQGDASGYQLLERLLDCGVEIRGCMIEGYWNPIANFEDFQTAQQDVLQGLMQGSVSTGKHQKNALLEKHYLEEKNVGAGIWRGVGAWLHPTVQITPPVVIGAGCRIDRHVELGPNVVIGANCIIDEGATVQESTILPETYIGKLLHVQQRVVQQQTLVEIPSGTFVDVADPLLLNSVDVTAPSTLFLRLLERLIALFLLMTLAPFMLIIGLVLWVNLGSTPIQLAERVGRKAALTRISHSVEPDVFTLYHFRVQNAAGASTWFSSWVERWELYRLPELWNVVCGDLALVGVKPLTREEDKQVEEPWQKKRYDHQAGVTGLWYTEMIAPTNFEEQCIVDAYHAATYSWRQDVWCLVQTPRAWAQRIYNARHQQRTDVQDERHLIYKRYAQLIDIQIRETDAR
ncbi:MAG: sugar transferase [Caldilineaceae bacterium]|nr:sugar transferase [Caldilineaceae bacterium]